MQIAVVGLGLIGGSLCKAFKQYTAHTVLGLDIDRQSIHQALACGAIDREITVSGLKEADLTLVCLHPQGTIRFLLEHAGDLRPGTVAADVCGVKKRVVEALTAPLAEKGITFVGTHPMAGREFSGFAYARGDLFLNASFILTPLPDTPQPAVDMLRQLALEARFKRVVSATPQKHDEIIAFTSQLAHVVSNAYIKSPSLQDEACFSAGSFLDLTRVAKLNEDMWTELFLMNREALLCELDTLIEHLQQYRAALSRADADGLCALLRDGRRLKEESLARDASL